ncbi:MAG: hypothetical protein AAB380_01935, partial [Verrucomicrobiota bacterium]
MLPDNFGWTQKFSGRNLQSVKFKRSHVILSLVVTLAAAYYGWWLFLSGDNFYTSKRNEPNRAALLQLYEAIEIGESYTEVLSAYWQYRRDELRLFAERSTEWIIKMPFELGATDWTLFVEFQDGRVSAVRVRTSD